MSGIRPRPGVYDEWNYAALEPAGMRKDESINHDESETIVPSGMSDWVWVVRGLLTEEIFDAFGL